MGDRLSRSSRLRLFRGSSQSLLADLEEDVIADGNRTEAESVYHFALIITRFPTKEKRLTRVHKQLNIHPIYLLCTIVSCKFRFLYVKVVRVFVPCPLPPCNPTSLPSLGSVAAVAAMRIQYGCVLMFVSSNSLFSPWQLS
jgi:hypothetical protein